MKALALVALLLGLSGDGESASCTAHGRSCSTAITFTGTIVPSTTMTVVAREGVLVVNIDGRERWGFYDENVLAITVSEDSIAHLGGRLVMAGEDPVRLAQK